MDYINFREIRKRLVSKLVEAGFNGRLPGDSAIANAGENHWESKWDGKSTDDSDRLSLPEDAAEEWINLLFQWYMNGSESDRPIPYQEL